MPFDSEKEFEETLIKMLNVNGWEKEVLYNYSPEQFLKNWANILYENNRGIDRLNDYPLTDGEMGQIMEQIRSLRTPLRLNGFINGGSVTIKRDNPDDREHFRKEVSLKIYDRKEISAGQSRYQIARQPQFPTASRIASDRRGDLMLLINGMPVVHIELKKSGIPVSQACNQIEKYSAEGVFTGVFSLVQIFVAMNPDEMLYFANPGPDGKFNSDFYFHWADFDNVPINNWKEVVSRFLYIPLMHEMIGFYTVADNSDGVLKVMRSYQYYAASHICDKVITTKWEKDDQKGGYIWHTTGSGKTMTSFKSAQLIASSKAAAKVIFLVDRIELGTQSLREYQGFADADQEVQATENTNILIGKLKSTVPADTLIVTSIQKMSNIKSEAEGLKEADLEIIRSKHLVFVVDECHRSTFGEMMQTIKKTFPHAIFFGFTGTPIFTENEKKFSTTATVFGNELHRYSIADGIRDGNVLGFDPYMVTTFTDESVREVIALTKAKADTIDEVMQDPKKQEVYYRYYNLPMAGHMDENGDYVKGVEDYLPTVQYETEEHQSKVVEDILKGWTTLSRGGKFHAIFATSSIPEATQYYERFRQAAPHLKVTALFDPTIDNNGSGIDKEKCLIKIIEDYNERYGQDFKTSTFAKMKKDISNRLAHKRPYERIETEPEKEIDLLIVVDQMLTGFDSKWINTLYLDKVLLYENVIQAFSRTNRLFGPDKPFGTIKYYRRPHTMKRNVETAVKAYSGDKPLGMFVEQLDRNLESINFIYGKIKDLFENAGVENFISVPPEPAERKEFAKLFKSLNDYLEAAKVQGFQWEQLVYDFKDDAGHKYQIQVDLDENTYLILALRYKELFTEGSGGGGGDAPYDLVGYLTTIDLGHIDADYMNSRFVKFYKLMNQDGVGSEALKQAEDELHASFATLTQEEQKFANLFLHDIERGDAVPEDGKTLRDYITEYMTKAKDDQIGQITKVLGLDEKLLRKLMADRVTEANINQYGRLDALKATVDKEKAKHYFENVEGKTIIPPKVHGKIDKLLREFILSGGFDIEIPK